MTVSLKSIQSEKGPRAHFDEDASQTSFAIKPLAGESQNPGVIQILKRWFQSLFWSRAVVTLDGKEVTLLVNKRSLSKRLGMPLEKASLLFSKKRANEKLQQLGFPELSDDFDSLPSDQKTTILTSLNAFPPLEDWEQGEEVLQKRPLLTHKAARKVTVDLKQKKIFIHLNKKRLNDETLGKGSFSRVSACWRLFIEREKLFIKEGAISTTRMQYDPTLQEEMNVLEVVRGQAGAVGIATVHGFLYYMGTANKAKLGIFMDKYLKGTLFDQLKKNGNPTIQEKGVLARELLSGLATLHNKGIVHRDIKPENILLDEDGHGFLSDFNLSVRLREAPESLRKARAGTRHYMAPEVFKRSPASYAQDVFSMGVLLAELYHRDLKTARSRGARDFETLEKGLQTPNKEISDLIRKMLSRKAEGRPTTQQALDIFDRLYPIA